MYNPCHLVGATGMSDYPQTPPVLALAAVSVSWRRGRCHIAHPRTDSLRTRLATDGSETHNGITRMRAAACNIRASYARKHNTVCGARRLLCIALLLQSITTCNARRLPSSPDRQAARSTATTDTRTHDVNWATQTVWRER